jgi:sugar phosphate isomerase/epimerase
MARLKIGVCLNSLDVPFRRALAEAQKMGVRGVQMACLGDLAPDALSQTGRREVRHLLKSHDLELSALFCPLRRGLDVPENLQARIDCLKKAMTLSFDLGPRLVIAEVGQIPDHETDPRLPLLQESLGELAAHGDRIGAALALETGRDSGTWLRKFLGRIQAPTLGVNYDPANLLMNGLDPFAQARDLAGVILHAHAKDARLASASRSAMEVPLGHGDIDWLQMIAVFEEIDYRGWLVVERETGTHRLADVAQGVTFLKRLGA